MHKKVIRISPGPARDRAGATIQHLKEREDKKLWQI